MNNNGSEDCNLHMEQFKHRYIEVMQGLIKEGVYINPTVWQQTSHWIFQNLNSLIVKMRLIMASSKGHWKGYWRSCLWKYSVNRRFSTNSVIPSREQNKMNSILVLPGRLIIESYAFLASFFYFPSPYKPTLLLCICAERFWR